ncbi:MAG: hypothetical protein KA138_16030 [Saprospiraceae bacterium]|nr:hypothetical protein [Saprospiraceae bacterium]
MDEILKLLAVLFVGLKYEKNACCVYLYSKQKYWLKSGAGKFVVEKRGEAGKFGGRSWGQGKWIGLFFVALFKSFILMLPFIKASTYVAKSTTKFDA